MGVASGCGEQEVGVASGSGWNLWVWLLGVVLRRYIDFLILLIPTPLVSVLFCSSILLLFFHFVKMILRSYSIYPVLPYCVIIAIVHKIHVLKGFPSALSDWREPVGS